MKHRNEDKLNDVGSPFTINWSNTVMSGVASRVRRSFSRALSSNDDNEDSNSDSILEVSKFLLAKLANSTAQQTTPSTDKRLEHKSLLIIDSHRNEWARMFKGRMLHSGSMEIRVEQATLGELQVFSCSEKGASVSMRVIRNGAVIARSFRPDFVLLREYIQGPDQRCDFKNVLLGLIHGLVPSVNSLSAVYNFLDRPVVFSELLKIKQRLGKESFPLIEQNYYQSYDEMLLPPSLPVVVKVGSANSGYGKVCVASPRGFQDVASLVSLTNTFATSEPFLDGKFDLRILKIGKIYKVYKRTSITDSWKTNTGSATVEEVALTERYKLWADECSSLFGGLDIVCVEVIHTKDDKEYIVEVNCVPPTICPDKQEDDMRAMVNLVINRMEEVFTPMVEMNNNLSPQPNSITEAIQLISGPPSPAMPHKSPLGPPSPSMAHKNNHLEPNGTSPRPGSAPLEMDNDLLTPNALNGTSSLNSSNCSLESHEPQDLPPKKLPTRKASFAERLFGTNIGGSSEP